MFPMWDQISAVRASEATRSSCCLSFLRRRAYTIKHGDHAAEQRDELAAIAHQILPAAAFPRFPTRKLFVDMPRRLDVPLQWFVGHFPVLCDFVTLSMAATRSNAPER